MEYLLVIWASAVCALLVPDVLAAQFCSPRFEGDCAGNNQDVVFGFLLNVEYYYRHYPAIADWDQELICTRTAFNMPPIVHTFVAIALAAGASFLFDVIFFTDRAGSHAWYLICANLVGIVCALPVAAFMRWRRASVPTRLDMRIRAFEQKLLNDNPKPKRTERGPHRAVSAGKIHELLDFFSDFISNRNAYYLDRNILMPLTKPSQLSAAELMGPQLVNFFVSHFWGSQFVQFVEAIRQHAEFTASEGWRSLTYWVCFLSNNQWEVQKELGNGDWRQSSFFLALQSQTCRATCMVLDRWAKPLQRSWCLFEVLQTYKLVNAAQVMADDDVPNHTFQGLVFCTADGIIGQHDCFDTALALAKSLSNLSVHNASASNPDDQRMIMELVDEEEMQSGTTMDAFLRGNMKSTLQLAKDRFDDEANTISDMLGLAPAGSSMRSTLETANVKFDEKAAELPPEAMEQCRDPAIPRRIVDIDMGTSDVSEGDGTTALACASNGADGTEIGPQDV